MPAGAPEPVFIGRKPWAEMVLASSPLHSALLVPLGWLSKPMMLLAPL